MQGVAPGRGRELSEGKNPPPGTIMIQGLVDVHRFFTCMIPKWSVLFILLPNLLQDLPARQTHYI